MHTVSIYENGHQVDFMVGAPPTSPASPFLSSGKIKDSELLYLSTARGELSSYIGLLERLECPESIDV